MLLCPSITLYLISQVPKYDTHNEHRTENAYGHAIHKNVKYTRAKPDRGKTLPMLRTTISLDMRSRTRHTELHSVCHTHDQHARALDMGNRNSPVDRRCPSLSLRCRHRCPRSRCCLRHRWWHRSPHRCASTCQSCQRWHLRRLAHERTPF